MTPAARLAAAIELGGLIDSTAASPDSCFRDYFRRRRYAGGGDRRAVFARVIEATRCRARLDWWLDRTGLAVTWRSRVLAHLILADGAGPDGAAELFAAPPHGPGALTADERAASGRLAGQALGHADMPPWVRHECPAWLYGDLERLWGPRAAAELDALNAPAPVDLRVNIARAGRDTVREALGAHGHDARPTPWSPWGLRLAPGSRLADDPVIADGLAEVQDEGSQLIALLATAAPGMTVVDLCAGAGGKSLALGAAMARDGRIEGRLVAADTDARRLKPLADRLSRAALHGVTVGDVAGLDGAADRVLVDAPCSGSGIWRRRPDLRWRLSPADLAALTATQDAILDRAAPLVRPGGRLVYATCSVLPAEDEERVARFLDAHDAFSIVPARGLWEDLGGEPPPGAADTLRVTPASSGTDGFFVAVLQRDA